MSGPQFLHLQSYSRKANGGGQSVQQVLDEAERIPEFCKHVEAPKPPVVVDGVGVGEIRRMHDELVAKGGIDVTLKDGRKARRGIRKDRHTLMTAVASHPLPTDLVKSDSSAREAYENWRDLNLKWLRKLYGDQLVSVIEHWDEKHPHIHAYILPLDDPTCSARQLNPAWRTKEAAMQKAKLSGHDDKGALKLGNAAYRARARELQDDYFENVSIPTGLTRVGPKRERLSRAQWKARKDQARRDAKLHSDMQERVERIVDVEDGLDISFSQKALELADKLVLADHAQKEAEEAKRRSLRRARAVVEDAHREAQQLQLKVREELAARTGQVETSEAELEHRRLAFELEKKRVVKRVVLDVAKATVRVLIGALTGTVQLEPKKSSFLISDRDLAKSVDDYGIGAYLEKPVMVVLSAWQKISAILPRDQVANLEQNLKEELGQGSPPSDRGAQP